MAGGYDGSIRINTSIDTQGFQAGISKISSGMKGVMGGVIKSIGVVAAVAGIAVIALAMIGIAIAGMAIGIASFGVKLISAMSEAISRTSTYGQEISEIERLFADVKGACYAAFSPLIEAALPYIRTVINWLVNMLNTISMIIAALLGQKTVMQYIAGSADSASTATGRLAGNTSKAAKAAKGALAAFDQLNVLQQDTADNSELGGMGGGAMKFKVVPVPDDIIKTTWDSIKQWFHDVIIQPIEDWFQAAWVNIEVWAIVAWIHIKQAAADAWSWISQVWQDVGGWFQINVFGPVSKVFQDIVAIISALWTPIADWFQANVIGPLSDKFNGLVITLMSCWQEIYDGFIAPAVDGFMNYLWPIIAGFIQFVGDGVISWIIIWTSVLNQIFSIVSSIFDGIVFVVKLALSVFVATFKDRFDTIISIFQNTFLAITDVVSGIIDTIGGIIKFITGVFMGDWKLAWEGVKDIFKGIFESLGGIVKDVVNNIVDLINGLLRAYVTAINTIINGLNSLHVEIPSWVPVYGGKSWGMNIPNISAPQLPRLATGAVIPPNAAFLAMLGDQRSGTNIEAPANLIRQIVGEELDARGTGGNITVRFEGTMGELIRVLKPSIDRENQRIGTSLIAGGSVA
jgi:hypothetical protein